MSFLVTSGSLDQVWIGTFTKNSISSFGLHSVASYTQGMHTPNKYPYYYLPIITSSILDLSKMFHCFKAPVTSTLLLTPPAGMCAPTLPHLLLIIYNHQMLSPSLYHQTLFPTPSIDNGRKNHLWSTHIQPIIAWLYSSSLPSRRPITSSSSSPHNMDNLEDPDNHFSPYHGKMLITM